MYCPSCGLQQTQDLRYCPRCGANLNPPAEKETPPNLVGPIWAVSLAATLVTLIGLGFVFVFLMVTVTQKLNVPGSMLIIVSLFLLVVLFVATLIVRQLSRLLSLYQKRDALLEKGMPAGRNELGGRVSRQLEGMRETPPDVTENTTRTFEPAPRDRQTKPGI